MLEFFNEMLDRILWLYETAMGPVVIIGLIAIVIISIPSIVSTFITVTAVMCTQGGLVCLILLIFFLAIMWVRV